MTTSTILRPALVYGFGAAVAMWTLGFIARFPGLEASPVLVASIMGLTQILAGRLAARAVGADRALPVGAVTGLIAGGVNLLILGSLLSNPAQRNTLRDEWLILLGVWLIAFPTLGAIGAALARPRPAEPRDEPDWLARFAVVAAAAVLPLLTIGGLVTSARAGLAVPDWPNSFGFNMFLLPLSHMQGGVYFEHGHRLFGTLVGLCTITLLLFTLRDERRAWVKGLAALALLLVIAQGVLGALRVTGRFTLSQTDTRPLLSLALVHGVTGQLFFAYMASLACILSPRWKRTGAPRPASRPGSPRSLSLALLALLVVQLALGATARHFHDSPGYLHVISTHALNAFVVLTLAVLTGVRASRAFTDEPALRRTGKALMHTTGLQIVLGGAALVVVLLHRGGDQPHTLDLIFTTAHQALGAVLMALAGINEAWSRRLIAPAT